MYQITEKSTKNEIISNIVESGLHNESASVLQKNYKKAELLDLLTELNKVRIANLADADQDIDDGEVDEAQLDEILSGSDGSLEAEDMLASMKADEEVPVAKPAKAKRRPAKKAKAEKSDKPATPRKTVGMHLAEQMKSIRGTIRAKLAKAEQSGEAEEFTFYTGSIDKPGLTLVVRVYHEPVETIDASGESLIVDTPVYEINNEKFGKSTAYQTIRTHFSL